MATMDPGVALQMMENYSVTRKQLIDKAYGINDTVSVWFSIDEVNSFMQSLSADVTGVRIYLAAYDKSAPSTPNQTTIIAIGTTKGDTGSNVDVLSGGGKAAADGDNPPYNNAKLCPPIC